PLDLMQPYRLEMGTKLDNPRGDRLYDFWAGKITEAIEGAIDAQGDDILLNLASNEYFDSIDTDRLGARVLNVNFKDLRGDSYRVISFYLKRLRGTMTDWMVRNEVTEPEELKAFDERNYYFSEEHSTEDEFVFLRDEKP
ncbi:MAG: YaaA family protein, partial [Persicimonas sp.]